MCHHCATTVPPLCHHCAITAPSLYLRCLHSTITASSLPPPGGTFSRAYPPRSLEQINIGRYRTPSLHRHCTVTATITMPSQCTAPSLPHHLPIPAPSPPHPCVCRRLATRNTRGMETNSIMRYCHCPLLAPSPHPPCRSPPHCPTDLRSGMVHRHCVSSLYHPCRLRGSKQRSLCLGWAMRVMCVRVVKYVRIRSNH